MVNLGPLPQTGGQAKDLSAPVSAPFGLSKGLGPDGSMISEGMPDRVDPGSHLALVGPPGSGQNPGLFDMARGLLAVGRAVAALFGYFVGIGSQLLRELLSNPTADTRQLVRIIRDLQAQGLDIDSAIALRELPNGDIGVYAIRDPDDPFPELLAIIKPDGTIVTQAPPSGASVPLEWNPGDRRVPEWDGPDIQRDGWQPGTVQIDQMQRNRMPEDLQNSPSSSLPSGGFDWEGLPQGGLEFDPGEFRQQTFPGTWEFSPRAFMEEVRRNGVRRDLELMEEAAREAIERSLGNSPFVTGSDPIAEVIEAHGPLIEVFLHALAAQLMPGPTGGASILPAPSSATANVLRRLMPAVAAAIVNRLGARLSDVPEIYREALGAALAKGDPEDPFIARALKFLVAASRAASRAAMNPTPATGDATDNQPLTDDEAAFLDIQIREGRLTMEQFNHFRALNPALLIAILIHRIIRFNAGEDVSGLRFRETDPVPETDPSDDIAPPADLVHSWDDIREVLDSRYGMRLTDGYYDAIERGLARHSEAEMCAIINAAIPYLDRIQAAFPNVLRGLSFTPYSANPPAPYPQELGPYNGLTNTDNGTIFLMPLLDFYRRSAERDIDGATKFMLTLLHEIGHAIASKAPEQMRDFGLNLSPVLEIAGPASTNAGEDAMPMDEALELLFPHLPPETRLARLFMHYDVRVDDAERLAIEEAGGSIWDAMRYEGTLQVYRSLPVRVTDILPMIISKYSGTNASEGFAEAFAHYFLDRGFAVYPDTLLPHSTERPRGPLPANLQMLLERALFVAGRRDEPVGGEPYPDFIDDDDDL